MALVFAKPIPSTLCTLQVDIYENPSEHYGFMPPSSVAAVGSAEEILKPVYYMEEDDGLNGGGPLLKVGYGEGTE